MIKNSRKNIRTLPIGCEFGHDFALRYCTPPAKLRAYAPIRGLIHTHNTRFTIPPPHLRRTNVEESRRSIVTEALEKGLLAL